MQYCVSYRPFRRGSETRIMLRITAKFYQYREKYLALARKATVVSVVLMAAFATAGRAGR